MPTLTIRRHFYNRMTDLLFPQLNEEVEFIALVDNGAMTLGKKMNLMYGAVVGKYVVCVNDDDKIPGDYINRILEAATSDADILLGKIKQMWNDGKDGQIIERYENVIPAKLSLVREYTRWDEGEKTAQDSDLARLVESNAKSTHKIDDEILYYQLRRRRGAGMYE